MRFLTTLIVAFIATSCSNVPVEVGSGPIKLSPEAQAAYERYASSRAPAVFVVSEDGEHFQYHYCAEARCRKAGGTAQAIADCQAWSGDKRCYVYDRLGDVVWDNESDFRGPDKNKNHTCLNAASPPEQRVAACSDVLEAIDLRPQDRAVTHRRRAVAYLALERYADAVGDFSAVLDNQALADQLDITDRSRSSWYLERGLTYEVMGNLEKARSDYESALQYFPEWSAAKEALQGLSS